MTSERDIERLLDRWFTERPTEVADRVLDEVADRIGRLPQRRAWRVLRRDSHVNSYLKPLLAVAAVIVVVTGSGLLGLWMAISVWLAARLVTRTWRARGSRWRGTGAVRARTSAPARRHPRYCDTTSSVVRSRTVKCCASVPSTVRFEA